MASLSLSIQTRLSPLSFLLIPFPKPARESGHPLHTPFLRRFRPIPSLNPLTAFSLSLCHSHPPPISSPQRTTDPTTHLFKAPIFSRDIITSFPSFVFHLQVDDT